MEIAGKAPDRLPREQPLGVTAPEALDHTGIITERVIRRKSSLSQLTYQG